MSSTALIQEKNKPAKRLITLERFLERYTNREDSFKYEWNKGIIEKRDRTMNRNQFLIYRTLQNLFIKTGVFKKGGIFISEVDMYLPTVERTRRTDIAVLTGELMEESRNGNPTVCPFVIEIISKNEIGRAHV